MKGENKFHKVLSEMKAGTLHSGSGEKVTNQKQAQAIAFSEARKKNPHFGKPQGEVSAALKRRIGRG